MPVEYMDANTEAWIADSAWDCQHNVEHAAISLEARLRDNNAMLRSILKAVAAKVCSELIWNNSPQPGHVVGCPTPEWARYLEEMTSRSDRS